MENNDPKVLLIEDDTDFRKKVASRLRSAGIEVYEAPTIQTAKRLLDERRYTFVFIDHNLGGEHVGVQLCKRCLTKGIRDFAVVTGHEDDQTAKAFLELGINSFYPKTKFVRYIDDLVRQIRALSAATSREELFAEHFVTSDADLKNEIQSVATSFSAKSIFISGETGVGKTSVAKLIHAMSGEPGQFVHLNCAQTQDSLIEAELFGYAKGAFTGATEDRKGKMQLSENGTLFLDEIGNLSPRAQEKLLVAIEERRFYPVGSEKVHSAKFRLITATKEDVLKLVKTNRFREDLYYRIAGVNLHIPPLRRRAEDIPLLIKAFLDRLSKKILLSDDVLSLLRKYRWPGNVRELKHLIDSFESKSCGLITQDLLPAEIRTGNSFLSGDPILTEHQFELIQSIGLQEFITRIEQEAVRRSLLSNQQKQNAATEELKITKTIFYRIYKGMASQEGQASP